MIKTKLEANVKERVKQSELRLFIKLVSEDNELNVKTVANLADLVSKEFNVICKPEDIRNYYEIDKIYDEAYEVESRKIEYYQ